VLRSAVQRSSRSIIPTWMRKGKVSNGRLYSIMESTVSASVSQCFAGSNVAPIESIRYDGMSVDQRGRSHIDRFYYMQSLQVEQRGMTVGDAGREYHIATCSRLSITA